MEDLQLQSRVEKLRSRVEKLRKEGTIYQVWDEEQQKWVCRTCGSLGWVGDHPPRCFLDVNNPEWLLHHYDRDLYYIHMGIGRGAPFWEVSWEELEQLQQMPRVDAADWILANAPQHAFPGVQAGVTPRSVHVPGLRAILSGMLAASDPC